MRSPRLVLAALLALTASACGDDAAPRDDGGPIGPEPPETPTGVHVLAGFSPTLPTDDLAPLAEVIGDASFVGLGESVHTSSGYNRMKGRVIRYMVEELGFRAFAFESPWLEARATAEYVATCAGGSHQALQGLLLVWRDEHVGELLRWLCEYNAAHPTDSVIFFGIDIQEPWRSAPAVRAFVQAAAPAEEARVEPLFECLGAGYVGPNFWLSEEAVAHAADPDEARNATCMAGIADVEAWIDANATSLAAATSARALEEARLSLIALRAWQDQLFVAWPAGYESRDRAMAEMLLRVRALDAPGRRTIVWAWNWHLALRYEDVHGFNDDPDAVVRGQGARGTGTFLKEELGDDYVAIGLIAYIARVAIGAQPPVPTLDESVELRLHELGFPYLFVDLRDELGDDLLPPGETYQISQEWGDPYAQFHALIFLEYSAAMEL